jgi:hypothetical protein
LECTFNHGTICSNTGLLLSELHIDATISVVCHKARFIHYSGLLVIVPI